VGPKLHGIVFLQRIVSGIRARVLAGFESGFESGSGARYGARFARLLDNQRSRERNHRNWNHLLRVDTSRTAASHR
jgi:hypothetical protein